MPHEDSGGSEPCTNEEGHSFVEKERDDKHGYQTKMWILFKCRHCGRTRETRIPLKE